jgi:histidinol-phosphate aminotransferase
VTSQTTGQLESDPLARLPLRDDLRGRVPYGAPQLDVPVRLNTNENSYDVPEPVAARSPPRWPGKARHLNRYPDREFTALRDALAGYLGHGVDAAQVWAGNGSNEVLQHVLQAFGGPGRTALGFTPAYSMHPIISAGTGTRGWTASAASRRGRGGDPFGLDADGTVAQVRRHDADVVFLCSRTTRPAPRSASTSSRPCTRRAAASSSSTRRTPSSPGPGRRPRSPCCPAGSGSSSPAR